jgi:hypothetical protein
MTTWDDLCKRSVQHSEQGSQQGSIALQQFGAKAPHIVMRENIEAHQVAADTSGNALLALLGEFIQEKNCQQCLFIPGPTKGLSSAQKKYSENFVHEPGAVRAGKITFKSSDVMRDICRGTIVCLNNDLYLNMGAQVRSYIFVLQNHHGWGKTLDIKFHNEGDKGSCGYSDMNVTLQLPTSQKAELQINVKSILYGKMGKAAFQREVIASAPDSYESLRNTYKVPGGCGHILYEMYKEAVGVEAKASIEEVSRKYYNLMRGKGDPIDVAGGLEDVSKSHKDLWERIYAKTPAADKPDWKPGESFQLQ